MARTLNIVLAIAAVACEAFGYWGLGTQSGRRHYDEMAGMIPFAAMLAGGLFAAGAAVAWYMGRRQQRSSSRPAS